jgi:3-deoxy-D-manno-octulosonic-acid transferase
MRYLLNILYLLLLVLALPRLIYAALRYGKYRDGWGAKFLGRLPIRTGPRRCIWLHAVSVGEVNLLRPLLTAIEAAYPDWDCVITTTTLPAYELAKTKYAPRTVAYCPLDFSWAVSRALRHVRPDVLILTELELWPNLITTARRKGVRLAIVNGRMSDRSWRRYAHIQTFMRSLFQHIDLLAVQNEEYAQRFRDLGAPADRVHVTGSIKFDGAQTDRDNPLTKRLVSLANISPSDVVFLAGSTQHPEEKLALDAYRRLVGQFPQLRLILVPRHPKHFDEVAELLKKSGSPWAKRSELEQVTDDAARRILLVDTIGELGGWWGAAQIAYVGGSMGSRGGQNMIEPAAYGAAVAFGPNTQNFRDVVSLMMSHEAAAIVQNDKELTGWVERCLRDPAYAQELGTRARSLVATQVGATQRTLDLLRTLLEPPGCSASGESLAA